MPSSLNPAQILRRDAEQAQRLVQGVGKDKTLALLQRAHKDLTHRLANAEGLSGPGQDSFTATHLRAVLAQVRAVLVPLKSGMQGVTVQQGKQAAEHAAVNAATYLQRSEQHFKGSTERLNLDGAKLVDRAVAGTESSILNRLLNGPDPKKRQGILDRYGQNVVDHFEGHLQQRVIQRTPWGEVRDQLTESSPFLQGAPAHWAERIVRTETMHAENRAANDSIVEADKQLGDMCKIISSTFDSRTGCLIGSTRITGAVVRAIFRRRYEGEMVRIITKAGRDFTTTPNHPMLTRRGWVHANALQSSDYLICDGGKKHSGSPGYQDVTNGPTPFGELFESAKLTFGVERYRGSKPDFHGDGMDGDVDVVRPRGLLGLRGLTPLFKPVTQDVFAPACDPHRCPECGAVLGASISELLDGLGIVPGNLSVLFEPQRYGALTGSEIFGDALQRLTSLISPDDRFGIDFGSESGMGLSSESKALGFGSSSWYPESLQSFEHVAAMSGHRCRNFIAGHSASVEFDQVVEIRVTRFDGHVFNLSTTDGYFTIDDAYTSNSDSFAVHGQIRRPNESFQSWFGSYPHPPDRPNDRSIVVPHRVSWPIPGPLAQKDDGAVAARWSEEGRKGSPPGRPLMSTIPMDQFGKAPPPTQTPNGATESAQDEPPKELAPAVDRRVGEQPQGSLRGRWPDQLPDEPEAPKAIDLIARKLSDATGSNPGGVYQGSDGVNRYVKFYSQPVQAYGEHLANSLYSDLGLGGVDSQVAFTPDNKPLYASTIKPDVQTLGSKLIKHKNGKYTAPSVALAKRALEGFAADVLMANWDAAGLNLDNMLVDSAGAITRIDNGAAFLTRAQGTLKPAHLLNDPTEWNSLLDPYKNPAYSKLASIAGVTKPEDMASAIRKGVKQIVKVRDEAGGWDAYVDSKIPNLNVEQRGQMIDMLDARTKFLEQKVAELPEQAAKPKSVKKVKPVGVDPGSLKPITQQDLDMGDINYDANLSGATAFLRKHQHLPHLEAYTASAYREINQTLAGIGKKTRSAQRVEEILGQAEKIQNILIRAKAEGHAVEGTLWRGFKGSPSSIKKLMESDVHTFDGFTSMSSHEDVSRRFAESDYPVLLRIRQRSAIPIDTVSRCRGEYEALLPAGTKFQVIAREKRMHAGKEWLHVDVQEL